MRYSLTALLTIVFLIASVMALWMRREPWVTVARELNADESAVPAEQKVMGSSPDRTRRFKVATLEWFEPQRVQITTYWQDEDFWTEEDKFPFPQTLFEIPIDSGEYSPRFIDDDTITIHVYYLQPDGPRKCVKYTYRRRFPEWWWGHFYRPEVWLSLLLIGVILTRIARNQLQAEKESGVQDPV